MISFFHISLLLAGLASGQEPTTSSPDGADLPEAVAITELPLLTAQMRASDVSEEELRALLETALGSGVSLSSLVQALEVVVDQLEQGAELSNLALRLPGLIGQGFVGDALAERLVAAGPSAAAALPVVEPPPQELGSSPVSAPDPD